MTDESDIDRVLAEMRRSGHIDDPKLEFVRFLRLDQASLLSPMPPLQAHESWAAKVCGFARSTTPQSAAVSCPTKEVIASVGTPAPPAAPALAVEAEEAARICGIGRTLWYRLKAAGRLPQPLHLGRRVLWRTDELRDWMAAGCPSLHQWRRIKEERT